MMTSTIPDLVAEALNTLSSAGLLFDHLDLDAGFRRKKGADHIWYIADTGTGKTGCPYLQVTAGNAKETGGVDTATCVYKSWECNGHAVSRDEGKAIKIQLAAAKRKRDEQDKKKASQAATKAALIWQNAKPVPAGHPYLTKKGVVAHGLKLYEVDKIIRGMSCRGAIMVPVRIDGDLTSIQFISAEGKKRFLPGGKTRGGYHHIGSDPGKSDTIYIVEGYATADTIMQATPPGPTSPHIVIAFSASNLLPVARTIRSNHPDAKIVICADNDRWTKGNPGASKAKATAHVVGGSVLIPDFTDITTQPTDFNDLMQLEGLEQVQEQLRALVPGDQPPDSDPGPDPGPDSDPGHTPEDLDFLNQMLAGGPASPEPDTRADEELQKFGENHAVALIEGKAVIVYREKDENTGFMRVKFMDKTNALMFYANLKIPLVNKKGDTEYKPIIPIWLSSFLRKTYSQVHFTPVPGLIAGDTTMPDTPTFNLYSGLEITPKQGDCQRILDHILEIWCRGEKVVFEYVVNLLARMFQYPQEVGHVVIVLKSGEGTGKNIIMDILVRAFGSHAVVATKPGDLTGRFNDYLGTAVMVFANEAVWGGDRTQEGALKSLITDERLDVEKKYMPRFSVKNRVHLFVASNNDWAVPVGIDDRRFLVLDVDDTKVGQFDYFVSLQEHIKNCGGEQAFIYYLLNRDISNFNPREMPAEHFSEAKQVMKMKGADPVFRWWEDCLGDGEMWYTQEIEMDGMTGMKRERRKVDLAEGWHAGDLRVIKTHLFDCYVEWCTQVGIRHKAGKTTMMKKLREICPDVHITKYSPEDRRNALLIPKISQCRKMYDEKLKHFTVWD